MDAKYLPPHYPPPSRPSPSASRQYAQQPYPTPMYVEGSRSALLGRSASGYFGGEDLGPLPSRSPDTLTQVGSRSTKSDHSPPPYRQLWLSGAAHGSSGYGPARQGPGSPQRSLGAVFVEPTYPPPPLPRDDFDLEAQTGARSPRRHVQALELGAVTGLDDSSRQKLVRMASAVGGLVSLGLGILLIIYLRKNHHPGLPSFDHSGGRTSL